MTRKISANIGPTTIEIYPVSAFSRVPVNAEDLWRIIGPTVDYNIRNLPLWQVFTTCYWEGLQHGYAAAREQLGADLGQDDVS